MMKKDFFCLLMIILTVNSFLIAQNIKYPIKKVGGKEYYLYPVKSGEGLFSVSRTFGISTEEIIAINPDAKDGLQSGQTLLIPIAKSEKPIQTKNNSNDKFIEHKVIKGQTVYGISKLHNISLEDLKRYNSNIDSGLKEGMVLKIPTARARQKDSIKNILEQDSKTITKKTNDVASLIIEPKQKNSIKIAFLLPFLLDQENSTNISRFYEFYSGALLAIKDAKEKGVSFEVYTYDSGITEQNLQEVLKEPILETMNLIVGPALSNQVVSMSKFAFKNHVYTLIPFSSKIADIETNPYLFQFNSGVEHELEFATKLFTSKYKNTHIIFADLPNINSNDEGKNWADNLKKKLNSVNRSFSSISLPEEENEDMSLSKLTKFSEHNLLIFNTDKFNLINPYINSLIQVASKYDVLLYEPNSWRVYTQKLPKGISFSPFVQSIDEKKLQTYDKNFQLYFNKPLTRDFFRYDLLGYDLTNYFAQLINKYGNNFVEKINKFTFPDGIQSFPQFEKVSKNGGYVNKQININLN